MPLPGTSLMPSQCLSNDYLGKIPPSFIAEHNVHVSWNISSQFGSAVPAVYFVLLPQPTSGMGREGLHAVQAVLSNS